VALVWTFRQFVIHECPKRLVVWLARLGFPDVDPNTVTIPVERYRSSTLPSTCVITGLPAAEVFGFRFSRVPGGLPVNASMVRSINQRQQAVKILLVVALGLFLLSAAFKSLPFAVLAVVALAAASATGTSVHRRLPAGTIYGDELVLHKVHPAFIDALSSDGKACAGCPASDSCSTEEKATCDGHDHDLRDRELAQTS
jgi:hypothetical protein